MTLSSDLTGLGVPPLQAERMSTAGVGPITVVPTGVGGSYSTGYQIKNAQYLIYLPSVANGGFNGSLSLPPIGSDNGALIGDDFVICNGLSATVSIYPPSNVSIIGLTTTNAPGTAITLASNSVITIWAGPTTTTWIYK
jgi:hypothetical protein